MNDKKLTQEGAEGSENYQAANNLTVHRTGLSFTEAKEVVMLLMQENFIKFSEQALITAKARAEEITNAYLDGLAAKNPSLVESVEDPGVQMALVVAQREYVKTGDKELVNMLVQMLVERTSQEERNLLQITLDESLTVAGKLTTNQIKTVLAIFLIKYHVKQWVLSLDSLKKFCDKYLQPLVPSVKDGEGDSTHIVACNGALIISQVNSTLAERMRTKYPALFSRGSSVDEIINIFGSQNLLNSQLFPGLFIRNLHDESKVQIGYMNLQTFENQIKQFNLDESTVGKLRGLFNTSLMDIEEVKNYLCTYGEYMEKLFSTWDNKLVSSINLTNIGQAIAVAAHNTIWNEELDYSTWIH